MMTEFIYGDRVKQHYPDGGYVYGTVVDEREAKFRPVLGCFHDCLPQPVAVLWDEPGETWWTPGELLELA